MSHEGEGDVQPEHVLRVRLGHGANCSSIGSVIDTLFATATVAAAVLAAVLAALNEEEIVTHGPDPVAAPEKDADSTTRPRPGGGR